MSKQKAILAMIAVAFILLAFLFADRAMNQEAKLCKDFTTGEIHVVEANMPCPYPTVEL